MKKVHKTMQLLQNLLLLPALGFLSVCTKGHPGAVFTALSGALLLLSLTIPELWWLCFLLFWFCLGMSLLNRRLHQEKHSIIEGLLKEDQARWLHYQHSLTWTTIISSHLFLLLGLVQILRESAISWGSSLFHPPSESLLDWGLYALDLLWKAALFDIPEIYKLNLVSIQHVGFWGSTLVFICRLIILALIFGALLRWRELQQILKSTLHTAEHYQDLAKTRLLLILRMYPGKLGIISKWAHDPSLSLTIRAALLEVLGEHKNPISIPDLEQEMQNTSLQPAALRGMATMGQGSIELIQGLFTFQEGLERKEPREDIKEKYPIDIKELACEVLVSWKTPESISLLHQVALLECNEFVRGMALRSLGTTGDLAALPLLLEMMLNPHKSKDERFGAKDAILEIGELPQSTRIHLQDILQHSPHPDNRRFAGIVLGELADLESFGTFIQVSDQEEDPHSLMYILNGISSISQRVIEEHALFSLQPVVSRLYKTYQLCKHFVTEEETPLVVRLSAIHTIASLSGLLMLMEHQSDIPHSETTKADVIQLYEGLMAHPDPQIADVARTAYSSLPEAILEELDEADDMRRDITTCIGITSFERFQVQRRSPSTTPSNPFKYLQKPSEREDATSQEQLFAPDSRDTLVGVSEDLFEPNQVPLQNQVIESSQELPLDILKKYHIQSVHHRGQIAQVFKVQDRQTHQEFALKITSSKEPTIRGTILSEIQVLQACASPYILPLREVFEREHYIAFTSPWMPQTLFQLHKAKRSCREHWHPQEYLSLMEGLCKGLAVVHARGWCHGDIKLENIFFQNQQPVLFDFNSARELTLGLEPRDGQWLPMGTPYYMAPEQIQGKKYNHRADIYALGVLSYELLTGHLPMGVSPTPVHILRPEFTQKLDEVIQQATAYQASKRYPTIEAFWQALSDCFYTPYVEDIQHPLQRQNT